MHTEQAISQSAADAEDVGFTWWRVWAGLGLTLGNLFLLAGVRDLAALAFLLIILNSVLMVMILRYNKHAFLIATILSLNPLLWLINGIYLKRRWHHPKVNAAAAESASAPSAAPISASVQQTIGPEPAPPSAQSFDATPLTLSPSDEENVYARAADEIGSDALRKGLWAKSLADADGNEAVARARYIRARSQQLLQEHRERLHQQQRERQQLAEAARQAQLTEEKKAFEALPKGSCPNCSKVISLSAAKCDGCGAVFSGAGAWKPVPR